MAEAIYIIILTYIPRGYLLIISNYPSWKASFYSTFSNIIISIIIFQPSFSRSRSTKLGPIIFLSLSLYLKLYLVGDSFNRPSGMRDNNIFVPEIMTCEKLKIHLHNSHKSE